MDFQSTEQGEIVIEGASQNNLKSITVRIPKHKITVITGVSGSGKSSLAYDTLFSEGERRYFSTLSLYARTFIKQLQRPEVKSIKGITPSISIEQKIITTNPRSTVGSISEAYDYLRLLFSKVAEPECPVCGAPIKKATPKEMVEFLFDKFKDEKIRILSPVVIGRKGEFKRILDDFYRKGFLRARVDGEYFELSEKIELSRNRHHNVSILVDTVRVNEKNKKRLHSSILKALEIKENFFSIELKGDEKIYSTKLFCPVCGVSLPEPEPRLFSYNSPYGWCKECKGFGEVDGRVCEACGGKRLNEKALSFKLNGEDIGYYALLPIEKLFLRVKNLNFYGQKKDIAKPIIDEFLSILSSMVKLSLGYLNLFRASSTLSGGESQRVRLSSQIGSKLTGVTYILDEPSIGLHIKDHKKLIGVLEEIKERGNTIVVVEHEENTIKASDWIIDLGPAGGDKGGEVLFQGKIEDFLKSSTLTAKYLRGEVRRFKNSTYKKPSSFLEVYGAKKFNLKNISFKLPLGLMVSITGVSGSGKSTLVYEVLYKNYRRFREGKPFFEDSVSYIKGFSRIGGILIVDQKPIGKNPRSTPATYVGLFDEVRRLFSLTRKAKELKFHSGFFSYNLPYGRCRECSGMGYKKVELGILPPSYSKCLKCGGKRYEKEILDVRYRGVNIADVLCMTVSEALEFFKNIPVIEKILRFMEDVGLGYIKLGQSATTLSGGEAQRLKISKELSKKDGENLIYILDEPTTGLHFDDVKKLINSLRMLVEKGNTVIVIEHNPDIIASSDWVIDLGPLGGDKGGYIVGEGTPDELSKLSTPTGEVLREYFNEN